MSNNRYKKTYPECSQVPGQLLPRGLRKYHQGTPKNCRGVMRRPPNSPEIPGDLPVPGEIKDWVPRFLRPYQREAILFGLSRPNVNFWHSCGCISGDAELVVNRAGKGFRISLQDLVLKFNGGKTKGRAWRKDIPTMAQSRMPDGTLRLNRITGAYASGIKTTYEVRVADGRTIRATLDHRFWAEHGWVPLEDIEVGDKVYLNSGQRGKTEPKPKRGDKVIGRGMKNHPHARKWRRSFVVALHRLVCEASRNGMTFEAFVARIYSNDLVGLKFLDPTTHAVHHKDGDHTNNLPGNLVAITHEAHRQLHADASSVLYKTGLVEVTSIGDAKTEMTYDLSMADPNNNFVANEFVVHNSGKTLASIYLALCRGGPIVVVTNANVRNQFARAFEEFTVGLHPLVLEGQTATPIPRETRVLITSWEILSYWREEIYAFIMPRRATVIWDEIHKAKAWKRVEKGYDTSQRKTVWVERKNSRSASAAYVSKAATYRIALTATPFRNTLMDLWSQLDILEDLCWGTSIDYAKRYCDSKAGKYGGLDTTGRSHTEELNARLREVCHIVGHKEANANLPPKRRQVCYIKPADQTKPPSMRAELKQAARRGQSAVLEVRFAEAAARKRAWITSVVLDKLESAQKVVVFTGRRRDCERLAKALEKKAAKLGTPMWWGHGDTPASERGAMAREYAEVRTGGALLVGTYDAFGESIDGLQSTDFVIFGQLPWTPAQVEQAEGRFVRQGQDRPVLICYAIAEGTVDEHVADLLLNKLDAVDETVSELGVQAESGQYGQELSGIQSDDEFVAELMSKY